ncbi:MAG: hypothetical protein NTV86_01035 [Planctomycetota bacterium]|nr:hypothetical protein [Planctomycetota bacterium]
MNEPTVEQPGETPAPERNWREEYLREVARSRKYRLRAQAAETQLEGLRGRTLDDRQLEQYQRLLAERDQAAAVRERAAGLERMLAEVVGAGELARALAVAGVGAGAPHGEKMLAQATALLADRIRVDVSGASPVVHVLDEAGAVMYADAEGVQPLGAGQFVAAWLSEQGAHFLPASGDTGSGARKGAVAPPSVNLADLDRHPARKAEFIARYGPGAYLRLARRAVNGNGNDKAV